MSTDDITSRAFVLGLDGVPWEFIRDRADPDTLPNFARLFEEGATGPLESTTPATTPLAWPSIATGVRPGTHGIYGFQKLIGEYRQEMYTSGDLRQSPLWEILSPALVGNVPMTYPATPFDGKMITGMTTPELDERSTHPPELREALLDRVPDYRIGLDWNDYTDSPDELVADLSEMVECRREAMRLLMDAGPWRLFFFVYTAPDRLQHLIWDDQTLIEHYRQLDEILGEVMEYVAENDATLYVVSDHGFGPISKFVSVNRALEEGGLLVRAEGESASDGLGLVPNRTTVERLIEAIGIDADDIRSIVPEVLYRKMTSRLSGESLLYDTDFSRTQAFVFGPGNVYVNDTERFEGGCVEPENRDEITAAVRSVLEGLEDPETGVSPVTVHDGDELFPTDEAAPDLVVDKVNGYECKTGLDDRVFRDPGKNKAGNHRSTGLFAAWGEPIEAGSTVEDATVYDVAPTLLHAMGEPIPAETDGRVLVEVLEDAVSDREPARRSYAVDAIGSDGDEDYSDVYERLQGLGYME
ncbi:alkaline phosphatase family protein [Halorubrum sp. DTA98]|uniref:alkaline phosphatase family protein n=1 Tax=Halorubrum sp. DTA98 TaxID=3402163 RepID=UPI003AAA24AC